ncbi:MAG TPA: hypothetical protein VIG29_19660, partial [Vicinamibacteria bacterium]
MTAGLVLAQEPGTHFDPRRPPDRELAMTITEPFTLAAVGDCILSHPLTPLLPEEPGDPSWNGWPGYPGPMEPRSRSKGTSE